MKMFNGTCPDIAKDVFPLKYIFQLQYQEEHTHFHYQIS